MKSLKNRFVCCVAHGSTRPRWKRVVDAAMERWTTVHGVRAGLYLLNDPNLSFEDYLMQLHSRGETVIEIVPLFVAPGGHVLDDLQSVTTRLRNDDTLNLELIVSPTLLERPELLDALGECLNPSGVPQT